MPLGQRGHSLFRLWPQSRDLIQWAVGHYVSLFRQYICRGRRPIPPKHVVADIRMDARSLSFSAFFRPSSRQYDLLVPVTTMLIPHFISAPELTLTASAPLEGWGAFIGVESVLDLWLPH